MKIKKILAAMLTALLSITLALGACSKADKDILIVAPDGVPLLNIAKMAAEASFSYEDYNFSYERAANLDGLIAKLNGEADFAIAPLNTGANLYNQNQRYVLAAATSYGIMYMISVDEDVVAAKSWQSLKGKTIGSMAQNGIPDVVLRYLLNENNIDVATTAGQADKVTISYMADHAALWTAMRTGSIDTIVTSEPGVTGALAGTTEAGEKPTLIFDLQAEWGEAAGTNKPYPQTGLFVKKSLIEQDKSMVNAVLAEIKSGIEYASASADNRSEVGQLAQDFGSAALNANNTRASFARITLAYVVGLERETLVNNFLQEIYNFNPNLIGGAMPNSGFYYQP